jgi:hypothetical protein
VGWGVCGEGDEEGRRSGVGPKHNGEIMRSEKWFENEKSLSVHEIVKLESDFRIDSLVCAIEGLILLKDDSDADINEEELIVLAVEAMEREVNNGGYAQFFSNSSWRFTPYLVNSLNRIGSTQAKQLAEQAISALGVGELTNETDVTEYHDRIQEAVENDDVSEKLDEIDSRYYEMEEDVAGLVFGFVKKNIEKFDAA